MAKLLNTSSPLIFVHSPPGSPPEPPPEFAGAGVRKGGGQPSGTFAPCAGSDAFSDGGRVRAARGRRRRRRGAAAAGGGAGAAASPAAAAAAGAAGAAGGGGAAHATVKCSSYPPFFCGGRGADARAGVGAAGGREGQKGSPGRRAAADPASGRGGRGRGGGAAAGLARARRERRRWEEEESGGARGASVTAMTAHWAGDAVWSGAPDQSPRYPPFFPQGRAISQWQHRCEGSDLLQLLGSALGLLVVGGQL
eukprot:gene10172-biopygen18270